MLLLPRAGRLLDVVNPSTIWTPSGNAKTKGVGSSVGSAMAATFDGSGDYYSATGYSNIVGGTGTFFMWASRIGVLLGSGPVYFSTNTGTIIVFQLATSNLGYSFTTPTSANIPNIGNTINRSICFTGSSARIGIYFNGGLVGSSASAASAFSAGSKTMRFANYAGGSGWDSDADIVIAGFTDRVWTGIDALSFHKNPWQLFEPLPRSIWVPVSAGATVPTLSAATYMPASITSSGFRPRVTAS
jgi:hypothetical protein